MPLSVFALARPVYLARVTGRDQRGALGIFWCPTVIEFDRGPLIADSPLCQLGHASPRRLRDNRDRFETHHYAFHVSDADFDAIFARIKEAGIPYGSGPMSQDDMKTNTWNGGRGVYFKDPNGHVLELLTRA